MIDSGLALRMRRDLAGLMRRDLAMLSPAARMEFLLDLYAPPVEREDGTVVRDPSMGLINRATVTRLLSEVQWATPQK